MRGVDGCAVIRVLMEVEPLLVVFVTAYSDHAIRAFEAQAVDYLVKPVEPERLADALDRVRQRLTENRGVAEVDRLKTVLAELAPAAVEDYDAETQPDAHAADHYDKLTQLQEPHTIIQ